MEPSKRLDWTGETCVILASGPSLTPEQIEFVRRTPARTITTNSTAFAAPWATVHFGVDMLWWKTYHAKLDRKRCWTQDRSSAERFGLNFIRQSARPGLGKRDLQTNGNSGTAAINLAYLFGCRRILLLGFDFREIKGRKHHHVDHPHPLVQAQPFGEWIKKLKTVADDLKAEGVEVTNCTSGSAVPYFPFSTIEKELG